MANIFDYLDWRGDLSFKEDPLNEVDNLIFSVLAYLNLDDILPSFDDQHAIELKQLSKHLDHLPKPPRTETTEVFFSTLPTLLARVAKSTRFEHVSLSHYLNVVDADQGKQFSAMVFSIGTWLHFVGFGGTDDTLVGWKEDLQMSFRSEVPAQKQAVSYLEDVMSTLPGKFYVGGHSKGGNLAVYAAANVPKSKQRRILGVYNNDGPGFQKEVLKQGGYQAIVSKVSTYLPTSSVIGILLQHKDDVHVIASSESWLLQHNPFSWELKGPAFVRGEGLSSSSLAVRATMNAGMEAFDSQEREDFVNALFDILQASGARTLSDLSAEKFSTSVAMIKGYNELEPETKAILQKVLELFFLEGGRLLKEKIGEEFGNIVSKTKSALHLGEKTAHEKPESKSASA